MSESIQEAVKHYESLAKRILGELEGVITPKLRELKPELLELRVGFRTLKPKRTISGCKTWADFCSEKLHRSKRAVNLLLVDKGVEREGTSHSKANADQPERTIADVDSDNFDDATRRTMAYFKPKQPEERKQAFIAWVRKIADDLGLSIQVLEAQHGK